MRGESIMEQLKAMYGGAEQEAQELRGAIQGMRDRLSVTGTVFYISIHGDDNNTGTSEKEPIQTISRLQELELAEGDAVLFERGGVYRTTETLQIKSGITYGAYGVGKKPVICGSKCNYAKDCTWTQTEADIWKTAVSGEAGVMTFDDDRMVGVRKYSFEELHQNGEYYHDLKNHELYLYSDENPADGYRQIEIGTTKDLFVGFHANQVTIQNLSLKYTSNHAISLGDNRNIEISGCEISWIGGRTYNEKTGVRLGNGIQIWNECQYVKVDHCYIHQIYDAALTFQGRNPEGNSYRNVAFTNNLMEYCSMNFEFWGSDQEPGNPENGGLVEIRDILFQNNVLRFAGYGWGGIQRPDKGDQAYLLGWNYTYQPGKVSNFIISENIFDCADCNYVWSELIFELQDNTYYQKPMSGRNMYNEIRRGSNITATDQTSFEKGILSFDKRSKKIKWLQDKGGNSDYE